MGRQEFSFKLETRARHGMKRRSTMTHESSSTTDAARMLLLGTGKCFAHGTGGNRADVVSEQWVHMSARSAKEARSQKGVRTVRNSDAILLLRALDANGGLLDGRRPILWLVIVRVFRIGKVHEPNCVGTTLAEVKPCAFARKLAWRDAPSRSWNFIDSVISCFKSHAESSSSSLRVRPCAP